MPNSTLFCIALLRNPLILPTDGVPFTPLPMLHHHGL